MSDYPMYDVVVEGDGPIPFKINTTSVKDSDQARQMIIQSGYTLPIMFTAKWNTNFECGDEDKNGQTWLEYPSRTKCGKNIILVIMRMWYNEDGECLCDED